MNNSSLERLRPWCGECVEGRWIYQAMVLEPYDQIRPAEEIAQLVDNRSLEDLQQQATDALEQILFRAHCGDKKAIEKFSVMVRNAVGSLTDLAAFEHDKIKAQAETFPDWPVLLSLNPQQIESAKEDLKSLAVGSKAATPTRTGQRVDPRNFWTRLARQAYSACRNNKGVVPELQSHCGPKTRKTLKFWRTPAKASFYTLPNGDTIIIADWQKQCVKLSMPITKDNFEDWWEVVKLCVLQHWHTIQEDYEAALKQVGQASKEEWFQRNRAVDAVRQAFGNLVGVP